MSDRGPIARTTRPSRNLKTRAREMTDMVEARRGREES